MPRAAKKTHKLAIPLREGELLHTNTNRTWKLGPPIGQGGFGLIYNVKEENSKESGYPYVLKTEPQDNGPLFVEVHFYAKAGKLEIIENYRKSKNFKTFGMPYAIDFGRHKTNNQDYRFLVMPKYSEDFAALLAEHKSFTPATAFKLAVQMLDVLEYIHGCGYVHGDIKGGNIMLGGKKGLENQAFLLDYGLAAKYSTNAVYKRDPKRTHDGTIEYTSRDAHFGVPTRRGDLEILGYNLIEWLGGHLPWENILSNCDAVESSKKKHMDNIPDFIKACFPSTTPPPQLSEFLEYINTLGHLDEPDYSEVRELFISAIEDAGANLEDPYNFDNAKAIKRKLVNENVKSKKAKKNLDEKETTKGSKNTKSKTTKRGKNVKTNGTAEEGIMETGMGTNNEDAIEDTLSSTSTSTKVAKITKRAKVTKKELANGELQTEASSESSKDKNSKEKTTKQGKNVKINGMEEDLEIGVSNENGDLLVEDSSTNTGVSNITKRTKITKKNAADAELQMEASSESGKDKKVKETKSTKTAKGTKTKVAKEEGETDAIPESNDEEKFKGYTADMIKYAQIISEKTSKSKKKIVQKVKLQEAASDGGEGSSLRMPQDKTEEPKRNRRNMKAVNYKEN